MTGGEVAEHRVVEHHVAEHLAETRADGVAVLRIDREDKLGALSGRLVEALGAYLRDLRRDPTVRALVVTGTGKGFVAGADVNEYAGVSQERFEEYQRESRRVFDDLERLPQVTIAAVNGYAFGGGFELALCCDLVVASTAARFGLPEVKLGLLPGGGGTQRLARACGTRFTKHAVLTGRTIRPDEAYARGLLVAVTEPETLLDETMTLARRIAGLAPLAVREAKRLVDDGAQQALGSALTVEQGVLARLFATADGQEGIRAFLDKREPTWQGR